MTIELEWIRAFFELILIPILGWFIKEIKSIQVSVSDINTKLNTLNIVMFGPTGHDGFNKRLEKLEERVNELQSGSE
jgi:hypothetical protein